MKGSLASRLIGTAIFTAFVGLSVAACDDSTTTTSTSSGGGTSMTNGELYAQAFCDRVFDCCNTADLVERFGTLSNVVDYAGCRILYRTLWEGAIEPAIEDGEAAGRVAFNQPNFIACMQSLDEKSCADFNDAPAYCEDIFTPKVAIGQPCFSSFECVDGTCKIPSGASSGSCVAKPTLMGMGQACTGNDECADGLFCQGSTCQTLLADGQSCGDDDECASGTCIGDDQGMMGKCGTICEGGGPGNGPVDKTLESIGGDLIVADCGKFFDCCSGDEFDTVLFPGIRTETQCQSLYGVFLGIALVNLHNSSVENKVEINAASMQACVDNFKSLSCQEFAKGSSFECLDAFTGLVANGSTCTDDNQCASKFCDQGTCAAIPAAGAACTSKCEKGNYCSAGVCVAQNTLGATCSSTTECGEGRCYGPNGMKTCALICDGI